MNLFAILIRGNLFYVIDHVNEKKSPEVDTYIASYEATPEESALNVFNRLILDIKNDLGIQLVHIALKDIYRQKNDE